MKVPESSHDNEKSERRSDLKHDQAEQEHRQWFNLSDPAAEGAPYDMESVGRFAGIDLEKEDEKQHLNLGPG